MKDVECTADEPQASRLAQTRSTQNLIPPGSGQTDTHLLPHAEQVLERELVDLGDTPFLCAQEILHHAANTSSP